MSKKEKNINKKLARKFFLPVFLFSIVLFFSSLVYFILLNDNTREYYNTDVSRPTQSPFTVIVQKHFWHMNHNPSTDELIANHVISGNFSAMNNNLGIISVLFTTHNRINPDKIIFRIRESTSKKWYFQSTYDATYFQNNVPFSFGFPVIHNAKDKYYHFELASFRRTTSSSLSVDTDYYLLKYKYQKSELTKNKTNMLLFIKDKIMTQLSLLTIKSFMISLSFLLLPYILWFLISVSLRYIKRQTIFYSAIKIGYSLFETMAGFIGRYYHTLTAGIGEFLLKNTMLILVTLLLVTLFTRFVITYTYTGQKNAIAAPEMMITNIWLGSDFQVGVLVPIGLMLQGKSIYGVLQNYGSAFTLLTTPFIYLLNNYKICNIADIASCHIFLYRSLLIITLLGYTVFIFLISFKKSELLGFLLLYFIVFILGIYGSMGLERGNIDVILSLITGFLLWWVLYHEYGKKKPVFIVLESIMVGCICAFLVNSKFFLLPIGLVVLYASRNIQVTVVSFLILFCILGYLPHILYHSPSNPLSAITNSVAFATADFFPHMYSIRFNYSFNALASAATSCIQKENCNGRTDSLVISIISMALFIFTFISPFMNRSFFTSGFKEKLHSPSLQQLQSSILWLYHQRFNKNFILFLSILSVASFILLPRTTYAYRLYFVLPVMMLLWIRTEHNKKARIYNILAIISLGITGFWIFMGAVARGFTLFESRGMIIFVVLGFYFMIKSGKELLVNSRTVVE